MSSSSLINVITYYQRSIEKNGHDEKRLLHCIEKLYKLPIKLEHLQSTGVGKTVNSLRKYDGEVGVAAKALVTKWKTVVAAEAQVADDEDNPDEIQTEHNNDDDYSNDNAIANTNTHIKSRHKEKERKNSVHHSSRHNKACSPSSLSRSKRHDSIENENNKNKSHEHKGHSNRYNEYSNNSSSSSSNRRKYDEYKSHNSNHSPNKQHSGKEKKSIHENHEKTSSSENENEDRLHKKLSIVEEIEQDFEVLDDDDDEEKLIIDDVSNKEKTEDVTERKSNSESHSSINKHHRHKDNSRKDEERNRERDSRKESNHSKENSKDSKHNKEKCSSNENYRKDNSRDSKRNSERERDHHRDSDKSSNRAKEHSRKENYNKDTDHDKVTEIKREKIEEHSKKSDSHKMKDKEIKSKHESKHGNSSHRSNGEHHKSKYRDKEKEKHHNNDKESFEKNEKHSKSHKKRKNSDSDNKSSSDDGSPNKVKIPKVIVDGIDSTMGTSFEEALGLMSSFGGSKSSTKTTKISPKDKTNSNSTKTPSSSSSRSPTRSKTPPLLSKNIELEPLDPSIALNLPVVLISPNYKPLPLNPTVMECVFSSNKPQKRFLTDEEAISAGISSKTMRTKVYSGVKTGALQQVPTLFNLCIRVLQKNIDGLEYTGGVPFDVLKPVLERATPQQLIIFEEYNPYLMEDSDALWQQHCGRYYRGQKRLEMETWREMFFRCKEEQDRKLSILAENIKLSQKQIQQPIRKTQLAYVDTMVKPPRNVQKKQEQYGTKSSLTATPASRVASLSNITPNATKVGDFRLKAAASAPDTVQIAVGNSNNLRPKKAPLMQKTIKFMKGRFKR